MTIRKTMLQGSSESVANAIMTGWKYPVSRSIEDFGSVSSYTFQDLRCCMEESNHLPCFGWCRLVQRSLHFQIRPHDGQLALFDEPFKPSGWWWRRHFQVVYQDLCTKRFRRVFWKMGRCKGATRTVFKVVGNKINKSIRNVFLLKMRSLKDPFWSWEGLSMVHLWWNFWRPGSMWTWSTRPEFVKSFLLTNPI